MDDAVKDILALLQTDDVEETTEKATEKEVKEMPKINEALSENSIQKIEKTTLKPFAPNERSEKKEKSTAIKPVSALLMGIPEREDKSIYNSKVLIRAEIYEVFMSLKRIKKYKSVSALIDSVLSEYIKSHGEEIKNLLYDSQNHEIF